MARTRSKFHTRAMRHDASDFYSGKDSNAAADALDDEDQFCSGGKPKKRKRYANGGSAKHEAGAIPAGKSKPRSDRQPRNNATAQPHSSAFIPGLRGAR
jgi:hypothetical protein